MKDELRDLIKEKRPNVAENTIRTYVSILNKVYDNLGGEGGLDFFKNKKKDILKYIRNLEKNQTKKTILSGLYVITEDDDYKKDMLEFASKVNAEYKEQKTLPERKKNLPTIDELKEKYDVVLNNLKSNPSIENYIMYFIVGLTSTKLMPPRRNDIAELKVKNFNKENENYITGKEFVFNNFKTAKYKDDEEKRVIIPAELNKYIKKFKKISDNDYLIYNPKTGKPYTSSAFTKKINSIYGKNIGIDAIRSIYLTNLYGNIPKISKLEEVADAMGNTINSQMKYYVKNDT